MQAFFSDGEWLIDPAVISEFVQVLEGKKRLSEVRQGIQVDVALQTLSNGVPLAAVLQRAIWQLEKQIITHVLESTQGNKAEAVRLLKIDYKTLYRKMRKYVI